MILSAALVPQSVSRLRGPHGKSAWWEDSHPYFPLLLKGSTFLNEHKPRIISRKVRTSQLYKSPILQKQPQRETRDSTGIRHPSPCPWEQRKTGLVLPGNTQRIRRHEEQSSNKAQKSPKKKSFHLSGLCAQLPQHCYWIRNRKGGRLGKAVQKHSLSRRQSSEAPNPAGWTCRWNQGDPCPCPV